MLQDVDAAVEALLRAEVPLREADVDLSFHAPDRDWAASLTRPTVDVFLFDVARDAAAARSGRQAVRGSDGWHRHEPDAAVRMRYLLTAWTNDVRDEHQLLSAVLVCLLRHRELPVAYARGALAAGGPLPLLAVSSAEDPERADLWRSINGTLKPAVVLVATVPVDTGLVVPVPDPPLGVDVRSARL